MDSHGCSYVCGTQSWCCSELMKNEEIFGTVLELVLRIGQPFLNERRDSIGTKQPFSMSSDGTVKS